MYVLVCVHECVCVYTHSGAGAPEAGVTDTGNWNWVSARAANISNHWAVSPGQKLSFINKYISSETKNNLITEDVA